ncbi:SDR family oxidoreductase [Sinosporangium siamense]|uniref:Short chain dehydrogenase n=1 Tax=Sinosporangium siamense TaxID=1367973 RepID=A0A919RE20_9ACTN|nr:SDR family oxidoreductase [Sinosporangium siamense]GII90069.1 short chain dehydrogenase [Sinosporangium siamense]
MHVRPTALITGASKGVGEAVAHALAPTHDLILGGRDLGALEALRAKLPGSRPWPVELTEVRAEHVEGVDRLDVLVHSAGIARIGTVDSVPASVWREVYEVNVVAVAELTRLLLPALRAAGGHVVLINSGAGLRANPTWAPYAASKFALRAFADALREEEAPRGLRVTTVFPGRIDTPMQRTVRTQEGAGYEPERYLNAASVAEAVRTAVTAGPDAHYTDITLRPARR